MTDILNGLYNFLNFIETNWGMIAAIVILTISIGKKIYAFLGKSQEERVEIAKKQISETMLKWVTEAEKDYRLWVSAGVMKRSQVIDQILDKYPILSKVTNQEEIIAWLDDTIDEALKTMRKIFEENAKSSTAEEVIEETIEATIESEVESGC